MRCPSFFSVTLTLKMGPAFEQIATDSIPRIRGTSPYSKYQFSYDAIIGPNCVVVGTIEKERFLSMSMSTREKEIYE
jgi:hypothetical protein